jgi:endonuclease YncB( thermonuclease family)
MSPARPPIAILLAAGLVVPATGEARAETLSGPIAADVIRVIDGDTLALRARIWIGQDIVVNARIRGIDAPELHGKCPQEKALAEAARDRLAAVTATGRVRLTRIEHDKYAGRVLADVITDDGIDLGTAMIESGLARAYDGGGRMPWCGIASLGGGDRKARP